MIDFLDPAQLAKMSVPHQVMTQLVPAEDVYYFTSRFVARCVL